MRNKLNILTIIVLCPLFMKAQETTMSTLEIGQFKKQVASTSKATTTIKTDFIQYKHLDFLSRDIETYGKMIFKASNNVRWEYTKPYQYCIIFKGNQLLINDGGSKSKMDIGNSSLFQKLNELIVNSVKGDLFNEADFTISYFKTPNYYKVVFVPKDGKIFSYIAAFELHFDKGDATVLEVKMMEPSQDYTRIVFTNRILNGPVDDAVFVN